MAKDNPYYQGCSLEPVPLEQKDLYLYEQLGHYAAEQKHDGIWSSLQVGTDAHDLRSRNGLVIGAKDPLVEPFRHLVLPDAMRKAVLVGEFEIATQASTEAAARNGYRRMFVFDVAVRNGVNETWDTLAGRRWWLEELWPSLTPEVRKLLVLTDQVETGFWPLAQKVVAAGGEGLVLKRLDSRYQAGRKNCPDWLKAKKTVTVDRVCLGVGIGEKTGKITSLSVGMYKNGELVEVGKVGLGDKLTAERETFDFDWLIGKVVEVGGFEIFRGGAIRSGGVIRVRDDKDPRDCNT